MKLTGVAFVLLLPVAASADDAPDVRLRWQKGTTLRRILRDWSRQDEVLLIHPADWKRLDGKNLAVDFVHEVPKANVASVCRAILAFFELNVISSPHKTVRFVRRSRNWNGLGRHRAQPGRFDSVVVVAGEAVSLTLAYPAEAFAASETYLGRALLPDTRERFLRELRSPDPRLRTRAARLLGVFGGRDAGVTLALRGARKNADKRVREAALNALGDLNRLAARGD